jgi:glutathione synthase/RimK-type ligase-like ATP-grasp enzyme
MLKILILTNKNDDHAKVVAKGLIKKCVLPILWFPEEFLHNQKSIQKLTATGDHSIILNNVDLREIDVVWYRRSKFPTLPNNIDDSDNQFVDTENRFHMTSLWLTLGEKATWVNPFHSIDISNSKVLQLRNAGRIGLSIPETIITNDKKTIIEFIHKNGKNNTIYKSFRPGIWVENNTTFSLYTTPITLEMLPDEYTLSLTPGIYQKTVKKQFELRIVFFGNEYIAVKINNSQIIDWRTLPDKNLKLTHFIIPSDIELKCINLMQQLGIVFGCFDFIVTPDDEYIFLEVNEMGQFLWIEEILPELKLLDRFCEFLISRNINTHVKNAVFPSLSLKEVEGLSCLGEGSSL